MGRQSRQINRIPINGTSEGGVTIAVAATAMLRGPAVLGARPTMNNRNCVQKM